MSGPEELCLCKVLVIDDDLAFGELTLRRLRRMGYQAKLHAGSRGAMDLLLHERFDLVVLDLNMPGLGGAEVMKMIRTVRSGKIKVMFYSSADTPELRRISELSGADGYLSKGASTQELEFRVRDLLRDVAPRSRSSAELRAVRKP